MNRRNATKAIGAGVLGSVLHANPSWPGATQNRDEEAPPAPKAVAGVRVVDSNVAKEATHLARSSSPAFLFHHCMRTYFFGALAGKASNLRFDEEVFYVACILHDLGLTESFMGDLPFEIQGAEAAKKFLLGRGMNPQRAETVWDGIAMHPLAISGFKRPEIALVAVGAGADVLGPDEKAITAAQAAEIVAAFPRLGFKREFVRTCADAVRRHPRTASRSFMRDIAERNVADYHPGNICDGIANAPFNE